MLDEKNDSSDDDQETQQYWFTEIIQALKESVAKKICQDVLFNKFDFEAKHNLMSAN